MKLQDILTTYWSQTTLVLLLISYFGKRIFDNKSKKLEINHSIFQQNRLNSLSVFLKKYAQSEIMFEQLPIGQIFNKELSTEEIDNLIVPTLNELEFQLIELRIYFDEDDYSLLKEIVQRMRNINKDLSGIYFNNDESKSNIVDSNDFIFFRTNELNKNKEALKILSRKIRTKYKS